MSDIQIEQTYFTACNSNCWTKISVPYSTIKFTPQRNSELTHDSSILSYYLPIAEGRIVGFIPFSRGLAIWKMQTAFSRIWTQVAMSIFYDDNHYTMNKKNLRNDVPSLLNMRNSIYTSWLKVIPFHYSQEIWKKILEFLPCFE